MGLSRRHALLGAAAAAAWTAAAAAAPRFRSGHPGVAPSPSGTGYDGVDADTMSRRASIAAEFAAVWPAYASQPFFTDIVATSIADFKTKFDALDTTDLTRWHRIRLDSSQPGSAWAGELRCECATGEGQADGHRFGGSRDRASAGGGVLVESTDPASPVIVSQLTVAGFRGLHARAFRVAREAALATDTSRSATPMVSVVMNNTFRDSPVVRLELDIGTYWNPAYTTFLKVGVGVTVTGGCEQLDLVNCRFNGYHTAISSTGIRYFRRWGCDFQNGLGDTTINLHSASLQKINAAFPETACCWARLNTVRNYGDDVMAADQHTDALQHGTLGDLGGYRVLAEFECYYEERVQCADNCQYQYSGNPTDGQTLLAGGVTYTFRTSPAAATDVQIGGTTDITLASAAVVIAANPPANFLFATESTGAATLNVYYAKGHVGAGSGAGATIRLFRVAGGTQNWYNDDAPASANIEFVGISSLLVCNDGICVRLWNGSGVADRVTLARPGAMPPDAVLAVDGFDYSNDFVPYGTSARKTGAVVIDHYVRNSVLNRVIDVASTVRTADGVFTASNASLTLSGNRYPQWQIGGAGGQRPADLLAGSFSTDADGKVAYAFTDDGAATQAAFRSAVYDILKLKNVGDRAAIGSTDPATWV